MHRQIKKGRRIRRLLLIFTMISVFISGITPAYAFDVPSIDTQKFPVEIYGDYLEYRTKAEQIVTKGKAYISYQDMKISEIARVLDAPESTVSVRLKRAREQLKKRLEGWYADGK